MTRLKYRLSVCAVLLYVIPVLLFAKLASASVDEIVNGISDLEFDSGLTVAIGDGINVADLGTPLQRCIEYENDDVKTDTNGAISSTMRLRMLREMKDIEDTFKYSLKIHASSKANFLKIANGSSSVTGFGRIEAFVKQANNSLVILIDAEADQGRRLIHDYAIRSEYKDLLDAGKYDEFIAACGTHFIRGARLVSRLAITIHVTGLNREASLLLANKVETSGSAGVGFDGLSASGTVKVTSDISNLLKLAHHLGKVSISAEASGGLGIPSVTAAIEGIDLSKDNNFAAVLTAIKSAAGDFSIDNAAPEGLLMVAYPGLSDNEYEFNDAQFDDLGEIFRKLLAVDQLLETYTSYQTIDPQIFTKYFVVYFEEVKKVREILAAAYIKCRDTADCEYDAPQSVQGLLLEDFIVGDLLSECSYANVAQDEINDVSQEEVRFLSSVGIYLLGEMRFLEEIDTDSIELFRITPDLEIQKLDFRKANQFRLQDSGAGVDTSRVLIDMSRNIVDLEQAVVDGEVSYSYLSDFRKHAARSLYGIRVSSVDGFELEHTFGYPRMRGCKIEG